MVPLQRRGTKGLPYTKFDKYRHINAIAVYVKMIYVYTTRNGLDIE